MKIKLNVFSQLNSTIIKEILIFLNFFPTWENMGQIIHVANFYKLKENITNIKKTPPVSLSRAIQPNDLDWPFPQPYLKSIGLTLRGFNFLHPNVSISLKNFFQPSQNLLNTESGTEEASTVPTQYSFYSTQQQTN